MAQPFAEPCSRGIIIVQPCPRECGREVAPQRRKIVLAACVLASSMAFIDGSALTVALPALRADFDADLVSVQWILNAYVLALASLTLIGGALADVYGKARMLAVGCLLFGLASVACALAPSAAWLILARAIQGVAAAIVTPASLALIGADLPARRAKQGNRCLGGSISADHRQWTRPGGVARRHVRLADDFLDKPALGSRRGRDVAGLCARGSPRATALRHDRCWHPCDHAGRACLGAQPSGSQRG